MIKLPPLPCQRFPGSLTTHPLSGSLIGRWAARGTPELAVGKWTSGRVPQHKVWPKFTQPN